MTLGTPLPGEELTLARKYAGQEMAILPMALAQVRTGKMFGWLDLGMNGVEVSLNNGVGELFVKGPMSYDPSWDEVSYEEIAKGAETLLANPKCQSIRFRIESPGGTSAGSEECAARLAAVAKQKPMTVHTRYWATSAAYRLATAAALGKHLYAHKSAQVGGVATLFTRVDTSARLAQQGVKVTFFSGGERKAWGYPELPLSGEEAEDIQKQASASTAAFQAAIAQSGYCTAEFWKEQQGAPVSATTPGVVNYIEGPETGTGTGGGANNRTVEKTEEISMEALDKIMAALDTITARQTQLEQSLRRTELSAQIRAAQAAQQLPGGEESFNVWLKVAETSGTDFLKHMNASSPAATPATPAAVPAQANVPAGKTPLTPPAAQGGSSKAVDKYASLSMAEMLRVAEKDPDAMLEGIEDL